MSRARHALAACLLAVGGPAAATGLASHEAVGFAGRLLATGGASSIEGSAGGGLVPWAVIAGYGAAGQWGGAAFATHVDSGDYTLASRGVALGWDNRLEVGVARQHFGLPRLADALGLPVRSFRQDIVHAKLRLAGDLVYTPLPQLSLGVQHKRHRDFLVPALVGARDDDGTDLYLAASKLFLDGPGGRQLLLNGVLRHSRAHQTGLLGFGGESQLLGEVSAAVLLDPRWAVGIEYRQKPDALDFAREDDWRSAFVAWFPDKRVAVVAAWADLGSIATLPGQEAWYVSIQFSR